MFNSPPPSAPPGDPVPALEILTCNRAKELNGTLAVIRFNRMPIDKEWLLITKMLRDAVIPALRDGRG